MGKWIPTKQTLWIAVVAFVLAVWSLPDVADDVSLHPHHHRHKKSHHVPAIPTMAEPQTQNSPRAPMTPAPAPTPAPDPAPVTPPGGSVSPSTKGPSNGPAANGSPQTGNQGRIFSPFLPYPTAKLRIKVMDGRSQEPIAGAEVVVIETEQRVTTDATGHTPWIDIPVIRDERFRPMVAQLHGQLGVIAYKNGYRDSIHIGIRTNEGYESETTVWMYKLGPGDSRIEPVLYQVPYHRVWLVELADRFRSKTQPGEGPERP
jgi:hypothetical protein